MRLQLPHFEITSDHGKNHNHHDDDDEDPHTHPHIY